jgi:hypothetical protein
MGHGIVVIPLKKVLLLLARQAVFIVASSADFLGTRKCLRRAFGDD